MTKGAERKMSAQAMRYWILLGIVAVFFAVFSFTINNFASPMTVTNLIRIYHTVHRNDAGDYCGGN